MFRGFPIHPWLSYLYPLVFLVGFLVCLRFRRVSPHMPWLIVGFAGDLVPYLLLMSVPRKYGVVDGWEVFLLILNMVSSLLLLVGLAKVLPDLRNHFSADDGDFDYEQGEPGQAPAR